MRGFFIPLIVTSLVIFQLVNGDGGESNVKKSFSDEDYDEDGSDDLEDSPDDDQDFQFEESKKPLFNKQKNQAKDKVKEIYLSWDLDLCKDVQCKPGQVCLVQKSRKTATCVPRRNKKKAQFRKESTWSSDNNNNNDNNKLKKKFSHKVSSLSRSSNKWDSQVLPWDSSVPPSSSSGPSSSNDRNQSWKECRPCPVTRPAFYCGTDNSTYSSMCRLQFHNCVHNTDIEVACKGFCPCGSPVNSHTRAKEMRNHERWNKYMDTLGKARRNYKLDKFVKSRAKGKLEVDNSDSYYHSESESRATWRETICSKEELQSMGNRLSDWFTVVLRDQKRFQFKEQSTDSLIIPDCSNEITNMFHRLDTDPDLKLSLKELYDLEHDKQEKCLKQYLDGCDEDRDTFLNPFEWCSCFDRKSKPCLIEKSQRKRLYGEYVPKCDREGFYQSIQCHLHKCWCVDRYGVEIADTRQTGIPDCDRTDVIRKKKERKSANSSDKSQRGKEDDFSDSDDSDDDYLDGSGDEP